MGAAAPQLPRVRLRCNTAQLHAPRRALPGEASASRRAAIPYHVRAFVVSSSNCRRTPCPPGTAPQSGATALYIAAQEGHTNVVKVLLAAGADREASDQVCRCCVALKCTDANA